MNLSKKLLPLLFIYSFIGLFVYLYIPARAGAQQPVALNLTAYPSTFTITAEPDSTVQQKFRIRNNSDSPLVLTLSIKKLAPDTQGNTTIKEFSKDDSYQNWISFDKTTITALPREWTDVSYSIAIPKDTAFGYYFVLYIAPKTITTPANQPQTTITGSLAIPVLLTVDKPGATVNGKMLSFMSMLGFSEYLPVIFQTTFLNSGNIFIRPTGNVFIKDWTGNRIDTLIINSAGSSILPGGKRTYETSWDNSFITVEPIMQDGTILRDSNGNAKTHLVFHFDRVLDLRIGKYTAVALTVIPAPQRDISFVSSTTFWVFPWKVVGLVFLVVILAGIGLINTLKSLWQTGRKVFKK